MIQCTDFKIWKGEETYHFNHNYQARNISLTNFVDQLEFPSLADFSAAAIADALKWTDLEQNVVYFYILWESNLKLSVFYIPLGPAAQVV